MILTRGEKSQFRRTDEHRESSVSASSNELPPYADMAEYKAALKSLLAKYHKNLPDSKKKG